MNSLHANALRLKRDPVHTYTETNKWISFFNQKQNLNSQLTHLIYRHHTSMIQIKGILSQFEKNNYKCMPKFN
jgi:hypothetical protein